jgi:hypothetical protein
MFARSWPVLLWLAGSACMIPSNVVAPQARAVEEVGPSAPLLPLTAGLLEGLYESHAVHGAAAASLRKLSYWFERDGRYSGAGLVLDGGSASFQTLAGRWTLEGDVLVLQPDGGGDPERVTARGAPGWIELRSEGGSVLLRKADDR